MNSNICGSIFKEVPASRQAGRATEWRGKCRGSSKLWESLRIKMEKHEADTVPKKSLMFNIITRKVNQLPEAK